MKKELILAICLVLFTACGKNETKTIDYNINTNISMNITDKNTSNLTPNSATTENGIYFAVSDNHIAYMDFETLESVPLCNRAECTHQDETCTAYVPEMINSIFTNKQEDKIFFTYTDIETFSSKVLMSDIDGQNRTEIYSSEDNQEIREMFVSSEDSIYFVLRDFQLDEMQVKLMEVNYKTAEYSEIYSGTQDIFLITGYDDNLIFYRINNNQDSGISQSLTSGGIEIVEYNITNKETKVIDSYNIAEFGQEKAVIVKDNIMLTFIRNENEDTATINKTNLRTNETTIIVSDFPFYGAVVQDDLQMKLGDDLYIFMMQASINPSDYKAGYYKLNIETGEFTQSTHQYQNFLIEDERSMMSEDYQAIFNDESVRKNGFKPLKVGGESEEYYVAYLSGTTYNMLHEEVGNENLKYIYNTIEIIKKEDFENNILNYIRIR